MRTPSNTPSGRKTRRHLCLSSLLAARNVSEKEPIASVVFPIPHPFPHFRSHLRKTSSRERRGNSRQTLTCPLTHCSYMIFPLITTSCMLCGPFLTLRGEPHGLGFPAGRTPDDNQVLYLEGPQTMTDSALVSGQSPHQILMTARDHAACALMVRRQPLKDMFVPSGEALGCHRGPLLACGKRETRRRHVKRGQILVLHPRKRAGQVPMGAALHDDHARELRDHHKGGRPLRCFLVPPRQGCAGGVDMLPHRPFHQAPEQ